MRIDLAWLRSLPTRRVLSACAALGALGLLAASFLPVLQISAADPKALHGEPTSFTGLDRHSVALILLALVALPAALLALRGMRVAAFAVLLCALATLLVAIGVDLPDLNRTGALGADFAPVKAAAGPGYYLETLAAVLLLISAAGLIGSCSSWADGHPEELPADAAS